MTIKKPPAPTFLSRLFFWGVLYGWLCTQESFQGGKKVLPHIAVECQNKAKWLSNLINYHKLLNHCQGAGLTWIRDSLHIGLNSRLGEDLPLCSWLSAYSAMLELLCSQVIRSFNSIKVPKRAGQMNCSPKGYWNNTSLHLSLFSSSMGQMVEASSTAHSWSDVLVQSKFLSLKKFNQAV